MVAERMVAEMIETLQMLRLYKRNSSLIFSCLDKRTKEGYGRDS